MSWKQDKYHVYGTSALLYLPVCEHYMISGMFIMFGFTRILKVTINLESQRKFILGYCNSY